MAVSETPPTIIIDLDTASSSGDTISVLSSSPIIRPLLPFYAEHYYPKLPFVLSGEPVGKPSLDWILAMRICGYPGSAIVSGHYFTKSITYDPVCRRRILCKNEHRHVPEAQMIKTRELWAVHELYYSGPRHDGWDEVVAANWDGGNRDGGNVDEVVEEQDKWIDEIMATIDQSLSKKVLAGRGILVPLLSNEQMNNPTEGGYGGAFALYMNRLAGAAEKLEGELQKVDAGGPISWEAEQDMMDLVAKYAAVRVAF
jgi:hypothetical protein